MATLTLRREDGRIVCERVVVADRAHRRMRGLLGRKYLRQGEGMVLRPGWSIHTAFMRFPIDAVFLDADQVVIRIEHEVGPWRTVSCRGAREVVEMAAGESRRRGLEVGDRVAWASRSAADARTERANGTFDDELDEPRARILVASSDPRFLRLARFLLGWTRSRGRGAHDTGAPARGDSRAVDRPGRARRRRFGRRRVAHGQRDEGAPARDPGDHRGGHRWQEPIRYPRVRPLERDRRAAPGRRATALRASRGRRSTSAMTGGEGEGTLHWCGNSRR